MALMSCLLLLHLRRAGSSEVLTRIGRFHFQAISGPRLGMTVPEKESGTPQMRHRRISRVFYWLSFACGVAEFCLVAVAQAQTVKLWIALGLAGCCTVAYAIGRWHSAKARA